MGGPAFSHEDFGLRSPDSGSRGETFDGPTPDTVRAARLLLPQVLASDGKNGGGLQPLLEAADVKVFAPHFNAACGRHARRGYLQPQPGAQRLADAMGAAYLPLPYAGAAALSQAVRPASAAPTSR